MEIKRTVLVILVGMLISSCGVIKRGTIPWEDDATVEGSEALIPINMSRSDRAIRDKLDDAYLQWKGTNYLLGGTLLEGLIVLLLCRSYLKSTRVSSKND